MKLWKWLTGLFFLLVIVDGALRKWVFPSYPLFFLVLKDFVLWGGFIIYAFNRSPTELPRPLRKTWVPVLIGAYISVVLLQAFNLRQPSLFVSALGLKLHLAYLPLLVLLPAIIIQTTERRLERFLWGYTTCIFFPIAALGIYQFFQPPTAWINTYVRNEASIDVITKGVVRITGTFSYIGSFAPYLSFSAFLSGTILIAGVRWGRRGLTILGALSLAATSILLPMTGSRSVVAVSVGGLAVLLLATKAASGQLLRIGGAAVIVMLVLTQGLAGSGLMRGWEALESRTEQTGGVETIQARTEAALVNSFVVGIRRGGLIGHGAGTAHHRAAALVPGKSTRSWLPKGGTESPRARTIIELGLIGWLGLMALKIALLYLAYRTVQRSSRPLALIVGGTAFCVLLAGLVQSSTYNLVRSALYWGSAGAMLGVWSLQQAHWQGTPQRRQTADSSAPA